MKFSVPVCMSANAGYIDTAGFLALHGLFTAHVNGNLVTLGILLSTGSSGDLAKHLALPVFCVVILSTRLIAEPLRRIGLPILRTLLTIQFLLLAVGATMAISLDIDHDGAQWPFILTAMVLVSAMAVQNVASRIYLASVPPTTLMTGSTTQIMIDLADLIRRIDPEATLMAKARLSKMFKHVIAFALGCAVGAALFSQIGMWCFVVPPVLAIIPVLITLRMNSFEVTVPDRALAANPAAMSNVKVDSVTSRGCV